MRLWLAMLVVMAIIIGGGVWVENELLQTTDQISKDLDVIEKQVKQAQWSEAVSLGKKVEQKWSAQRKIWSPFIHNQELDVIAVNLTRAVTLLEQEDTSAALAEISVIKVQLVQLHHQEVLTLQNIL